MLYNDNLEFVAPDNIYVIGAGRWSRVISGILYQHLPKSSTLFVHSASHADIMREWIIEKKLDARLKAVSGLPDFSGVTRSAVIIANAARDHEKVARVALANGLPVLVEKPLAMVADGARRLIDLANERNACLAATHVFLFARYIERFTRLIEKAPFPSQINFVWADPGSECRYGEQKAYDSSVSVAVDVLPHIISILSAIIPGQPIQFRDLVLERAGQSIKLQFSVGTASCDVRLARNDQRRCRKLELVTARGHLNLDFTSEPGTITCKNNCFSGDPLWANRLSPMTLQLKSFLAWAAGGEEDNRLTPENSYQACRLVEQVTELYRAAQLDWMRTRINSGASLSDDGVRYALVEIMRGKTPTIDDTDDDILSRLLRYLQSSDFRPLSFSDDLPRS